MKRQRTDTGITEVQLQILALFTKGFDRTYYLREVAKELSISPRTAQLNLEFLEKKGVLESIIRGKIRVFKLRKNEQAKNHLIMAELHKKMIFMHKELVMGEFISKAAHYIQGICLLFGSYAKGIANKESDIDLFIIGDYDKNKLSQLGKEYRLEISIKNYSYETFENHFKNDILIREVLNNHICLVNTEQFINEVFKGQ